MGQNPPTSVAKNFSVPFLLIILPQDSTCASQRATFVVFTQVGQARGCEGFWQLCKKLMWNYENMYISRVELFKIHIFESAVNWIPCLQKINITLTQQIRDWSLVFTQSGSLNLPTASAATVPPPWSGRITCRGWELSSFPLPLQALVFLLRLLLMW